MNNNIKNLEKSFPNSFCTKEKYYYKMVDNFAQRELDFILYHHVALQRWRFLSENEFVP